MITHIIRKIPLKKRRKCPLNRDEYGLSARKRTFDAFDHGLNPADISREYGISIRTARRYYSSWHKLPPRLEIRYQGLLEVLQKHPDLKHKLVETIADSLGMPVGEVAHRLQHPWGLKSLLMGRRPNYAEEERQRKDEGRLKAALALVKFIECCNMPPEELKSQIMTLIDEAIQKRKADQN